MQAWSLSHPTVGRDLPRIDMTALFDPKMLKSQCEAFHKHLAKEPTLKTIFTEEERTKLKKYMKVHIPEVSYEFSDGFQLIHKIVLDPRRVSSAKCTLPR